VVNAILDGVYNPLRKAKLVVKRELWTAYEGVFSQHLSALAPVASREACANIAHTKRKLRQRYVMRHLMDTDDQLMTSSKKDKISVHLKREAAKKLRLTVDYGAGALYANELPEFVKVAIDGHYVVHYKGKTLIVYIMAKPKSDTLERIFREQWEFARTPNTIYVAIFSDDAISNRFDLDLSACDSRQDVPAFLVAYCCMRAFMPERAEGLIKQCMLPLELCNGNKDQQVLIRFLGPFLGSGTVLTTILNHIIVFMIALAALYHHGEGMEIRDAFVNGARDVGHKLTIEDTDGEPETTTFLHRSGTFINGAMVPWTNLGCILKNFGLVWGDLECRHLGVDELTFRRMSNEERADVFFSRVINGWKHEPSNIVMDALRERFSAGGDAEILHDSNLYLFTYRADYSQHNTTEAIMKRYGVTTAELQELAEQIRHMRVGQIRSSEALRKIYAKDLGSKEFELDRPYVLRDWNC